MGKVIRRKGKGMLTRSGNSVIVKKSDKGIKAYDPEGGLLFDSKGNNNSFQVWIKAN